ncbi:MAG TPA: PAS domain S-box protein [Bacteroidia bacterium]|nr:PAS domain S-box protein [Bacteroidia bacterium]
MGANELHQLILDYSPFAIILTDEPGNILYLNKHVEELFNYDPGGLLGQKIETVIAFRMPEPYAAAGKNIPVDVLSKEIKRANEFLAAKKGGEPVPVEVSSTVFNISGITYISWAIRVISDEQKTLHDLRERVKEQTALLSVTETLFGTEDIADAFGKCAQHIRDGWQFPQQTQVRISLNDGREFNAGDFNTSQWTLSSPIPGRVTPYGVLEVCYSEEAPVDGNAVFLAEEEKLIAGLAKLLGLYLDHCNTLNRLQESSDMIRRITQQIPANTYQFEMFDDALPKIHFASKGLAPYNDNLDVDAFVENTSAIDEVIHSDDIGRFYETLKMSHVSQAEVSMYYRIIHDDLIAWRWIRAKPDKMSDGRTMWYACTQDITPLIEYTDVLEQILFDISHVIRRPVSSILGLTDLLTRNEETVDEEMIRDFTRHFKTIASEMDDCLKKLNTAYHEKKVSALPLKNFGVESSRDN